MKSLSALLSSINVLEKIGSPDPGITGIAYDSRRVERGNLFFALDGVHTDGHAYISKAVERGACAAVISRPLPDYVPGITYVRVGDTRDVLSKVSSTFYDHPSHALIVIGVTGTDGKSSTVSFIHQLLEASGEQAGFISTVEFKPGDRVLKNPFRQSTPEAPEIHGLLDEMRRNGKRFAVIESTSHGLSGKTMRLQDIQYDAAVYTNITHEHLEFHGTIENYRDDKANLFRYLDREDGRIAGLKGIPGAPLPFGVVNADDPHCTFMAGATRRRILRYSLKDESADLYAGILSTDLTGSRFRVRYRGNESEAAIPFPGAYNVENILASLLIVSGVTGRDLPAFFPLLSDLKPVKGRLHPIMKGQPFTVIVDYAHTPGGFSRVLPFARSHTKGKLTAVFGSGGERDTAKRPMQGKIAADYCDRIILSDEDPRLEDRETILRGIAEGCGLSSARPEVFIIPDRREGIRKALTLAEPGDTVLLLGKGHEASIIQAGGPLPWDEASVAEEILTSIGY